VRHLEVPIPLLICQRYYTQAVSPPALRPFLSYVVGFAVLVGEISTGSSCALNSANIIQSFVEVTHPNYTWHVSLTRCLIEKYIKLTERVLALAHLDGLLHIPCRTNLN
jgi:hypothetical protein